MASAAQGNHPPRCAQAPAEAYARPAGSGNRLPVLDSEAPKLPIHTATAVPQYGTQGSAGTWRRCQFGRSALCGHRSQPLWDQQRPQTRGQKHSPAQCPRTTFLCCQPARRCLPLRGPSKTARRSGNRPALCRRLGVRSGQHRRERLGDLLVASVVGMQTVGPTNQIPRTKRSWSLPCESVVQGFRCQANGCEAAADPCVRCLPLSLLSPRVRRATAPVRPQALCRALAWPVRR